MHYACTILFLSSSLSFFVPEGCPRQKLVDHSRGNDFRSVDAISEALGTVPRQALKHICCPLCRYPWPTEQEPAIMANLRDLRAKQLEDPAHRIQAVLLRIKDRFEHGADVARTRLVKGLLRLEANYHTALSFFACRSARHAALPVLACLRATDINALSSVSMALCQVCIMNHKLRVPCLRVTKLRIAIHHVWAPDLVSLDCSPAVVSSHMSALEVVTFAKWLSQCGSLREIVLSGMQWEKIDPGALQLSAALADKSMQVVDLSNNFMNDTSLQNLAPNFSEDRTPQLLDLSINCITAKGLAALLPFGNHIKSNGGRGVRHWGLRHNQLGDSACDLLSQSFDVLDERMFSASSRGPTHCVSSWDLRNNGITANGFKKLAHVFAYMDVARLGCNPLYDAAVQVLAKSLGGSLTVLDLRQAKIGDEGAKALGTKLVNANNLQELLLSGNNIEAVGARYLADGWAWLKTLRFVDLANNPIGSYGVRLMSEELRYWCQMPFRLCLLGVDCDDEGAHYLIRALEKHPKFDRQWTLELGRNSINARHVLEVRRLLEPPACCEGLEE